MRATFWGLGSARSTPTIVDCETKVEATPTDVHLVSITRVARTSVSVSVSPPLSLFLVFPYSPSPFSPPSPLTSTPTFTLHRKSKRLTYTRPTQERQLLQSQTLLTSTTTKLRERELQIERLERDRRYFADREQEEREGRERERAELGGGMKGGRGRRREGKTDANDTPRPNSKQSSKHSVNTSLPPGRPRRPALRALFLILLFRTANFLTQVSHSSTAEPAESNALAESRGRTIEELQAQVTQLQEEVEGEPVHGPNSPSPPVSDMETEADPDASFLSTTSTSINSTSHPSPSLTRRRQSRRSGITPHDLTVIRTSLSNQTSYLRTLESTNARLISELHALRERRDNVELLKEEVRGLEAKVGLMEEVRGALSSSTSSSTSSSASLSSVENTRALAELRLANAQLLEDLGTAKAALKAKEVQVAEVSGEADELRNVVEGLEADVRGMENAYVKADEDGGQKRTSN
ncbi:hypothetical protein NMY22_g19996 [Coprinellus aureogranulatus]|nr:hypothetical protein NMY22_g19996 [Coprinellus aureogranulatus]